MDAYPSCGRLALTSYSESTEPTTLRTDMESGPPRQTRVRSRVMRTRSLTYLYTLEQYDGFLEWVETEGAGWFDWQDPFRGSLLEARLVRSNDRPPYQAKLYSRGDGAQPGWEVSFSLETWDA